MSLSLIKRGQTAIVVVIIAAVALAIGLAIYAYFQPLFSSYFLQLQLESILSREMANQRIDLISTSIEDGNIVLWLVYSSTLGTINHTYYIMISNVSIGEVGMPINCNATDVQVYYCDPSKDADGIICSSDDIEEMMTVPVNPKNVMFNPMGRGWISLEDLYQIVFAHKLGTVVLCKAIYGGEPQILKIVLSPEYKHVKLYLLTFINDKFYVIRELRVS